MNLVTWECNGDHFFKTQSNDFVGGDGTFRFPNSTIYMSEFRRLQFQFPLFISPIPILPPGRRRSRMGGGGRRREKEGEGEKSNNPSLKKA